PDRHSASLVDRHTPRHFQAIQRKLPGDLRILIGSPNLVQVVTLYVGAFQNSRSLCRTRPASILTVWESLHGAIGPETPQTPYPSYFWQAPAWESAGPGSRPLFVT